MDFSKLKKDYESKRSGVPEQFSDRPVLKAAEVTKQFVNDEPVVIVRKPKNTNKDEDGNEVQYHRVLNKDGKPIFQDVAYIPVKFDDGELAVVCTATDETVKILKILIEDVDPKLVKGESFDDINRWEEYEAEELIEGRLCFKPQNKDYKSKKTGKTKTYPIAVLASAE